MCVKHLSILCILKLLSVFNQLKKCANILQINYNLKMNNKKELKTQSMLTQKK